MRDQLVEFSRALDSYIQSMDRYDISGYTGDHQKLSVALYLEATARKILKQIDGDLRLPIGIRGDDARELSDQVKRVIGTLDWSDTEDAVAYHDWVWEAASSLWASKHYKDAVLAAARSINVHLQRKLDRVDVADDKAIQEAFSEGPGRRLRIPGDSKSDTVRSRQRGAMHLGLGCFFAIRNPVAHEVTALTLQVASEQLATLSTLARLLDECDVVDVVKPDSKK